LKLGESKPEKIKISKPKKSEKLKKKEITDGVEILKEKWNTTILKKPKKYQTKLKFLQNKNENI